MNLKDYPPDWRRISLEVRLRAEKRCECEGECGRAHVGRCAAINGEAGARHRDTDEWAPILEVIDRVGMDGENDIFGRDTTVVLTVAHLWRGPCAEHDAADIKCGDPEHLKAMCQACHLGYDLPHHVARRKQNRFSKKAHGDLFG